MMTKQEMPMNEPTHERAQWRALWRIDKYDGAPTPEQIARGEVQPQQTRVIEENLLTTAGATALWNALIGTAGTAFSNANAYIGVGDSSTAAAAGQTDLQASTNKTRKAMDATYPTVSGATITFRSTFGPSDANYVWNEIAAFNASTGGTMLNRRVDATMGTKGSGTWVVTLTVTLS